ncbi:MAG: hypothetical protein HFH14_02750 [Lachnospiraceae bacterium]|nr:hypothetical protein [Lachnospiraceae bacterium]
MLNKSLIKTKNGKKTFIKKTLCLALMLSLPIGMTGCGSEGPDNEKATEAPDSTGTDSDSENKLGDFYPSKTPKEFSNDFLTITLTDDYEEQETSDYVFNYSSPYSLCFGMSETKESVTAAGYTVTGLDDYAVVAMQAAGITAEVTPYNDTTRTFTWEKEINNIQYCYKAFVTETDSTYWMFQFAAQKDVFDVLNTEYDSYYNSVVFKN